MLSYFQNKTRFLIFLVSTILILYRKLYINIVSIIVLNIETRQYNIRINLAISCSPTHRIQHLLIQHYTKPLKIQQYTHKHLIHLPRTFRTNSSCTAVIPAKPTRKRISRHSSRTSHSTTRTEISSENLGQSGIPLPPPPSLSLSLSLSLSHFAGGNNLASSSARSCGYFSRSRASSQGMQTSTHSSSPAVYNECA